MGSRISHHLRHELGEWVTDCLGGLGSGFCVGFGEMVRGSTTPSVISSFRVTHRILGLAFTEALRSCMGGGWQHDLDPVSRRNPNVAEMS